MTGPTDIREYLDGCVDELAAELMEWVRIPSVSAEPEHRADIVRSGNWLAGRLRDIGVPRAELWPAGEGVAVFARWDADDPDAPTVLVYSHHDVRAVVDEQWTETAPFEPVRREGRLYGRGASDAKGQVIAHIWAIRAHLAATGRTAPAVTLKLLVCGEEEIGSPNLAKLIEEHRDELDADVVMFSDSMLWTLDEPAVCTGIRGVVKADLTVRGAEREVHAGAVSGAAPNPLTELSQLLGDLRDDDGRITLPGFYDTVVEPEDSERKAIGELSYERSDWLQRTGTLGVLGETGYSVLERVWLRPSVEVADLKTEEPGAGGRGVLAPSATASLSFNLVPDQRPDQVADQLRAWVAERLGDHVEYDLDVPMLTSAEPYVTPEHPMLDALDRAMGKAFGRPAGRMRNGGTGPAELFARTIGVPVLFFGTGLPDDHWHGPDESTDLRALVLGAATLAHFYDELTTS